MSPKKSKRKQFSAPLIPAGWRPLDAPRVWDVFPYWRERWAVEARLRLWADLAPGVAYLPVACIGDRTHRGDPLPPGLPELPSGVEKLRVTLDAESDWGRENQQRNAVRSLLPWMDPDDLVLLCDADEIVDPGALPVIAAATAARPVKLYMPLYMFGTRWRNPNWWCHPAACRARDLPGDPTNELRLRFDLPAVLASGWHITYLGTDADIDAKLKAFAHAECDTAENREALAKARAEGTNMVDEPLAGPLAALWPELSPNRGGD